LLNLRLLIRRLTLTCPAPHKMQVDEIAWSGLFLNAAMKAQTKTSILSAFGWASPM
jgi:hypothetical protein